MTEFSLYWILRFDDIRATALGLMLGGLVIMVAVPLIYSIAEGKMSGRTYCRWLRGASITAAIGLLLLVFTPSTKQALIIVGGGATIEYLKENDVAKQLPDKAIMCLDKLFDEYLIEEDDNEK